MADKFAQNEIVATAPPVPNASPTPAEIAYGFVQGAADRPYFNYLFHRITEVLFDVQEQAAISGLYLFSTSSDPDTSLIYKEYFNGTIGNDVLNRTPQAGSNLRNDSGEINKYYFGANSTAVRTTSDEMTPVYTDCGTGNIPTTHIAQFSTKINQFSSEGDRFAVSLSCTGKFERTDVTLELGGSQLSRMTLKVYSFDNAGVETLEFQEPFFNADDFDLRTLTMEVSENVGADIQVKIKELNIDVDTGVPFPREPQAGETNDHGFMLTPHTFSINSLIIRNSTIVAVTP